MVNSDFLVPQYSVLEDCMILGICPFLLGCSIWWCIIILSSFLRSFVFLWYQFCHPFLILFESPLFFFWVNLVTDLLVNSFLIFSKKQFLILLIFCCFSLYFTYCLSIFIISFLLLIFGFACSTFLNFFNENLDDSFGIFLISWGRTYCYQLLSRNHFYCILWLLVCHISIFICF